MGERSLDCVTSSTSVTTRQSQCEHCFALTAPSVRDDRGEGGCLMEDVIWMMWANVGSEEGGEGDLIRFF